VADKRDGDDLFEDLDKFFAPIKDVDWDDPDPDEPREVTASEEHVSVRPGPTPDAGEPETRVEPSEAFADQEEGTGEDSDEAWYETSVLDVGAILDEDEGDEASGVSEGVEPDAIEIGEAEAAGADVEEPLPGWSQAGATGGPAGDETETAEFPSLSDAGEEVSPSDAELEAAAEHFADSVRGGFPHEDSPRSVELGELDEPVDDVVIDESDVVIDDEGALETPESEEVEGDILSDLEGPPRTVVVGSEGFGGPSWQEPTAVEVGADLDQRGGGVERDVPAAFMTGIVLAALALGTLAIGKVWFAVLATAVVLFAQGEFFGVLVRRGRQPATAVGLVTGGLMMAGAYERGESGLLAMFALGLLAAFIWFMTVPAAHRKGVVGDLGLTLLNVAWIPLLGGYLVALLSHADGQALVIAVVGLTLLYDTTAFLAGSIMGGAFVRVGFAPSISPRKSWEGAIAGTVVTVVVSTSVVSALVDSFKDDQGAAALLGLVIALAATFGDLGESLLKRDLGIKDMGSVLPGHGGVLDRIDSLLFVAPASFLLLRMILS
jgi:phosphatidate cytidylyltransferase